MSEIIFASSKTLPVPLPKEELTFREGARDDIPFIDELQKHYNNQLGFMPTMWLEGKIAAGHILIAEMSVKGEGVRRKEEQSLTPYALTLDPRVGYIIAQDKYMKREELGIIYQLAVIPTRRRQFIGAALLKAQFDRSAYGCRLYCCWCAQDIEGNRFWESMGFVPLAYRNGAYKKGKNGEPRVHIFWEKKIRGKDDSVNWWFPSKTDQGAMRADRIALPIPPGVDWKDLKPIEIPGERQVVESASRKALPATRRLGDSAKKPKQKIITTEPVRAQLHFGRPGTIKPAPVVKNPKPEKPKRTPKPKVKIDPKFIAASRELRDRYLEEVNEKGYRLESAGKYELVRAVESDERRAMSHQALTTRRSSLVAHPSTPLLEAA